LSDDRPSYDDLLKMRDEGDVDGLIAALKYSGAPAYMLGQLGDKKAVEPLLELLKSDSKDRRSKGACALGKFGDKRAAQPLISALEDEFPRVRESAAGSLAKIGGEDVIVPLVSLLENNNRDGAAKQAAIGLIDSGKPAVEALIGSLLDVENTTRKREGAAFVLGDIGDSQATSPLLSCLSDDDDSVRSACSRVLGSIGDQEAVEFLIESLADDYESVVDAAAEALGKIGYPQCVGPLIDIMDHEDEFVRKYTQKALKAITGNNFNDKEDWLEWFSEQSKK